MIIMFCIAGYALLFKKLDETPPKEQPVALSALLLILTSIVMFVLNLIVIARLSPQLNYSIQPSALRMGFFNWTEMSQIQNGTYAKTSTFDRQIIGNLGDVVYSSNKVLAYTDLIIAQWARLVINIIISKLIYTK